MYLKQSSQEAFANDVDAMVGIARQVQAKAGERGYQTLINEALERAIQADTLESVVRKTIREELRRT